MVDRQPGTGKTWADVADKGLEIAKTTGPFLERIFGQPADIISNILVRRLAYYDLSDFFKIVDKTKSILWERGIQQARVVPPKIGLPLLEAAALEGDDYLQDLWARLLANAMDPNSELVIRVAYIEILKNMTPLDAKILQTIYDAVISDAYRERFAGEGKHGVWTKFLPNKAILDISEFERAVRAQERLPNEATQLALWNLMRLGCIESVSLSGGNVAITIVEATALGCGLVEACAPMGD